MTTWYTFTGDLSLSFFTKLHYPDNCIPQAVKNLWAKLSDIVYFLFADTFMNQKLKGRKLKGAKKSTFLGARK